MLPLLSFIVCFCSGVVCGATSAYGPPPPGGLLLGGASAALGLLVGRLPGWLRLLALCGGAAVLGCGAVAAPRGLMGFRGGLSRVEVEVVRSACGAAYCSAAVRLVGCTPIDPGGCPQPRSDGFVRSTRELTLGAHLELLVRARPSLAFDNPTPAFQWPFTSGTFSARLVPSVAPKVVVEGRLLSALTRRRRNVRALLNESLEAPHAGVARALLLGEGQAVARELNDAIRVSGVSHVLAVSGMHVTVLAGALVWLVQLGWLWTPWAGVLEARRVAAALGVVLAPLVASFAGSSPSALRAAIASSLTYAVWALGRRPRAIAVSAVAALLCVLIFPRDALHPGLALSVLATHALLTTQGRAGALAVALRESLRTWAATLPFLIVAFGSAQVVGVAANLLLAPFGTLLIPLVVVHVLLQWLAPFMAPVSAFVFETASGAFVVAAQIFARLDPGLSLPPPTPAQALAMFAGVWAVLLARSLRARAIWFLCTMLACAAAEVLAREHVAPGEVHVTYVDVGQGDAALIETADGRTMLIDAGGSPAGGPDPGARAVVPLLRALRIDRLDVVALSHPHPDHYGGLASVLEQVRVLELWDTGQACAEDREGQACRLLEDARGRGTRILGPEQLCGRPHTWSSLEIDVLGPCPSFDETLGPNDNSLILRLTHGKQRFLFVGDAEAEQERVLTRTLGDGLRAEVLKVGHHGSRTSSSAAFLQAVRPSLVVVSAGRANRFGHPHAEVVDRLRSLATLLRTDRRGGIQLISDGEHLSVATARRDEP